MNKINDGIWIELRGNEYKKHDSKFMSKLYKIKLEIIKKTRWEEDFVFQYDRDPDHCNEYIFFTKDCNNEYSKPRIKISTTIMEDGNEHVSSIYGIGKENTVEDSMINILENKLKQFSNYDYYKESFIDRQKYLIIKNKHISNQELTKEEIIFLYEINYNIVDKINYSRKPWLKDLIKQRNIKKDFAILFDCKEENIGTQLQDFKNNEILVYIGDLYDYKIQNLENLKSLIAIFGDVYFNKFTEVNELSNLKYIYGNARFDNLKNPTGLENLKYVSKELYLSDVELYDQLKKLELVGYGIHFKTFDKRIENKNKKLVKELYK